MLLTGSATEKVKAAMAILDPKGLVQDLAYAAQRQLTVVLLTLAYEGYGRIRVISGRRSLDAQNELFGKGRSEAECAAQGVPKSYARSDEKVVSWIPPYQSKHVLGKAVDVSWLVYPSPQWPLVKAIARDLHVTWGGNWKVRDYGHFEV